VEDTVSPAQAKVVGSLLAGQAITQRERARRAGIPQRTFERVVSTSYSDRVVFDRYVPNFRLLGLQRARMVFAQPYLENLRSTRESWRDNPACVLLWEWPEALFGFFVEYGPPEPSSLTHPKDWVSGPAFALPINLDPTDLPVFFDFEGVWSELTASSSTMMYPHPVFSGTGSRAYSAAGGAARAEVVATVCRTLEDTASTDPERVGGLSLIRRRERRAIRSQLVERRVLLNPSLDILTKVGAAESIAFVHGRLNEPASRDGLLRRLIRMRIFPFLFASNHQDVLFATLTTRASRQSRSANRPAVLRNIERFLGAIEIRRESLLGLGQLVSHRYSPLLLQRAAGRDGTQ
jgi:hypothetical protein